MDKKVRMGGYIPIDIAEKKVRTVTSLRKGNVGYESCMVHLPTCYHGKKVRVIVVEES